MSRHHRSALPPTPDMSEKHRSRPAVRRRRALAAGATLAGLTLLVAACGGGTDSSGASGASGAPGASSGTAAPGGTAAQSGASTSTANSRANTLEVATAIPPASFDPIHADNSTVDMPSLVGYDSLTTFNNTGTLVGDLATAYSTSADGKSFSVTLRSGVKFQNGAPLTATDVAYTLNRIKKVDTGVASFITPYVSTTVVDPTHLVIHLSEAYTPLAANLTRVYILNSKLVLEHLGTDEGQTWLSTHDAGSGPYELQSYTPNQQSVFVRNPTYWGGWSGQAQTVIYKYLTAGADQRQALLDDDADIALDIAPTDFASFQSNKQFVVNEAKTNVEMYAFFKMSGAPTANKDLREAIAYAFNYTDDIKDLLKGAGYPVKGPMPSGMACSDPNVVQPTYDVAKAKQLLAASGLKNVTLSVDYQDATAEEDEAGPLLQANLKAIGIKANLRLVTYPQYAQLEGSKKTTPDIGFIYSFPQNSDPDVDMYELFDSKFINNGQDWGDFDSSTVNSLVEKAQGLPDGTARCALYDQAQVAVANDYVGLDISNPDFVVVYNNRLKGYTYLPSHHQTVDPYRIKVS
jgi:peptide/nickel transport system substrate-binding protein